MWQFLVAVLVNLQTENKSLRGCCESVGAISVGILSHYQHRRVVKLVFSFVEQILQFRLRFPREARSTDDARLSMLDLVHKDAMSLIAEPLRKLCSGSGMEHWGSLCLHSATLNKHRM